jgi:chemosensory pili system protein ChpA (sensor histidine kinase/response regulator)
MATPLSPKVDPSTLGWVKHEIDETLKQALVSLESFSENPTDKTRLRFCVTHLHQVVGTLMMVEIDGAAMLARESEALAEAMLNDAAAANPNTIEMLSRGILLLPDYLARLQAGGADVPLRHLTLMNEMRAARNATPISERELFDPDLSVRPPPSDVPKLSERDYAQLAKHLRPSYQLALLNWLRAPDNREALRQLGNIFGELKDKASQGAFEQLFWVAQGLVEALDSEGVEATVDRKKFFSRLDQQLKKIIDGADKSALRKVAEELTRGMLWQVAPAKTQGEFLTQVKRAFELDALFGTEDDTAGLPSPEVLQTVAQVLGKEIEAAQDWLSAYFDPQQPDAQALDKLIDQLPKMSGTLDMLSVAPLKNLIDAVYDCARAINDGTLGDPVAASMPMAQALVLVENSARDIQSSASDWRRQTEQVGQRLRALANPGAAPTVDGLLVTETELSEHEYRELVGAVGNEIGANLTKIEEALETFAARPGELHTLDEVPTLLNQIQGAVQILGKDEAARLVTGARNAVEQIQVRALSPSQSVMDGLAVCIGTVGAYMDGLRTGRRNLDTLVDSALKELESAVSAAPAATADPQALVKRIQSNLEEWLANANEAGAPDRIKGLLQQLASIAHDQDQARIERISDEMGRLLDFVSAGAPVSADVEAMVRQSSQALSELVNRNLEPTESAVPVSTPTPKPAPVAEPADAEIMQIFIEDASDVLKNIRREFAVWRNDPDNPHALTELRRGYHTIKGSGRMVGAGTIAEFAWALETLLNKLRDGKIAFSPAIPALLEKSESAIAQLIEELEGGSAPSINVEALRLRAHDIAQGMMPDAPLDAVANAPAAGVASSEPAEVSLPPLDGTLLEIFTNEARGHLATLKQEVQRAQEAGSVSTVTPALTRAAHTLAGNARSLNIPMMARAASEAEKMLHTLESQSAPLTGAHLDLLGQLEKTISDLVAALNRGQTDARDFPRRFEDLAQGLHSQAVLAVAREGAPPAAPIAVEPDDIVADETITLSVPTPARGLAAAADDEVKEALDPELLDIFQDEAVDIVGVIETNLRRLSANPSEREPIFELKRSLHTLKGGARMAGSMLIGTLAHNTESLLKHVEDGKLPADRELLDMLDEVHDSLVTMLDRLRAGEPTPSAKGLNRRLLTRLGAPGGIGEAPSDDETDNENEIAIEIPKAPARAMPVEPARVAAAEPAAPAVIVEGDGDEPQAAPDKTDARTAHVRVRTNLLNDLVNYAGEASIARARMEQQIWSFRDNLQELSRNVVRFREQLRDLEIQSESQILYRLEAQAAAEGRAADFDPLEFDRFSKLQQLSRSLTESLHDLSTIQGNLGNFVGEAETVLQQQARLNTDLQEGLMRTRMVSFSTQAARLRMLVRQTARELNKRVELDLVGADVEVDRNVLDRMIGPFEHMIRNSIDHGIELEAERRRHHKSTVGKITITTAQEGTEIAIRFSDDGAGLDIAAIRTRAIERGLLAPTARPHEEELIQFILMPGFSTAKTVTHLSGRGVGMDVVHTEVKQLGGTMAVDTKKGVGTTFTIRLPLTLSLTQALMVHVGEQPFAMPLGSVANIIEFPVERLHELAEGDSPMLTWNDVSYPYLHLGKRFGIHYFEPDGKKVPVLICRTGTREIAIQLDRLSGTREVVVKTLSPQLAEIKGIAGATILGDGRVVLILDVPGLWYREDVVRVESAPAIVEAEAEPVKEHPVVMVVDDSLTVRKVTSKHLQKSGYEVMVAKDGVDAVEQLRERIPDIMLVDIEMPRMDGYELTTRVRGDSQLKHIPIIMITSRAGAKHRQKAFDLGVDVYMSKPYQEDELFKNIETLLLKSRGA